MCVRHTLKPMELIFALLLTLAMAVVVYTDATRYIIPNWLNVGIVFAYIPFALLTPQPVDFLSALSMFGAMFALGLVLFVTRLMGGGDVKLLAALGPWAGWTQAGLHLLLYTALLGGLLAILLVIMRFLAPWIASKAKKPITIPQLFTHGAPVPYGLAIAGGFLLLLWKGKLPGLPIP